MPLCSMSPATHHLGVKTQVQNSKPLPAAPSELWEAAGLPSAPALPAV